ncbi:endonuclease/exonuclease/phosphatase family protein [Geojedonia litorea]|uniref:Endonuclease/exonuclease/phosphatase family protein n=1 Tax=Geojedonia litorea TaxID=1268269 RepID=A0ABV9MZS2_9FLAO
MLSKTHELNFTQNLQTVAFYNIENLFDIYDDEHTNDDDFLPNSAKRWTQKRYDRKLYKLGSVISQIGLNETQQPPSIVGLAEVENAAVLQDLISSSELAEHRYNFVHYDSTDERGIDVALLYREEMFKVQSTETFSVHLVDDNGEPDYTRDILLVTGFLNNDLIHVIVNHWSSRRDGDEATAYKRIAASNRVLEIINQLERLYDNPKIVVMGDFNDNPTDRSIVHLLANAQLFHPLISKWTPERGTQNHDFKWNLFDQIMCSNNLLNGSDQGYRFKGAEIFDEKFLTQYHGKYKGQPYRTYVGKKYKGGFSDHFPVYMLLEKD